MSSLPNDYLSHPYGILKEFTIGGATYNGEYANAVNTNLAAVDASFGDTLDNILLAAANNEHNKEIAYLKKLFAKVFNDDDNNKPIIYNDVKAMYDALITPGKGIPEVSLSQVIDTLQKLLLGLYDFDKSLSQNMALMKDFNKISLSDPLMKAIDQTLGAIKNGNSYIYDDTSIANKSAKTILTNICKQINTNITEYLNSDKSKHNIEDFTEGQQKLIDQLQNEYKSRIQQFYNEKFKVIDELDILESDLNNLEKGINIYNSKVKSKDKINADNKPIQQYIHELLRGAFGGQALEIGISLSGGGVETGKVINKFGRSIDADNILLGTASLDFFYPDMDKLTKQSVDPKKRITLTEVKNEIEDIEELKDGLVIMTSAKDQSTNKSFNSFTATNTRVKLKDPGSLQTRRGEIEQMFAAANCGGGVNDLIFALANLATDFVYEGKIDMAKKNLGTVCLAWMFDDAIEIVQNKSMFGNNIGTLHFYNVNNYIYTLSDILYKTAENVAKVGKGAITKTGRNMNYVNITISGTNYNPYTVLLTDYNHLRGIERWNFISDELMSNIKIGVNMNITKLFKELFTFKSTS